VIKIVSLKNEVKKANGVRIVMKILRLKTKQKANKARKNQIRTKTQMKRKRKRKMRMRATMWYVLVFQKLKIYSTESSEHTLKLRYFQFLLLKLFEFHSCRIILLKSDFGLFDSSLRGKVIKENSKPK
jgi:hypothetical protein